MESIKNINYKYSLKSTSQKIKSKELKVLCKQMSILFKSGCEITKILNILNEESNKKIKRILKQVSVNIQNGNSITDSFKKTNLFSNFFINMLHAGELSGNIDVIMNDLSNYYESEEKLKSKLISISIYPIILIIISIISGFFILVFIIPNFEIIFVNNGIEPPLLTMLLINLSRFVRSSYMYIFFMFLVITLLIYYLIKYNPKVKYMNDKIKLKIPFIKNLITLVVTTRFCRALNILIESGIHIIDAIDISSKVIDNDFVYEKLLISKEYVSRGNSISYSISESNIFSNSFISMLKIGEESGKLDDTLRATNDFYSEELDIKIDRVMKLAEPTITVIIGLVIGVFIIAMVMPMFDVINSIQ